MSGNRAGSQPGRSGHRAQAGHRDAAIAARHGPLRTDSTVSADERNYSTGEPSSTLDSSALIRVPFIPGSLMYHFVIGSKSAQFVWKYQGLVWEIPYKLNQHPPLPLLPPK